MVKKFYDFCNESLFGKAIIRSKTNDIRKEDKLDEIEKLIYDCIPDYVSECEIDGGEIYADEHSFADFVKDSIDTSDGEFIDYYINSHWEELYKEMEENIY